MQADQMRLRQALLNLMSNANKFTDRGTFSIDARQGQENGRDWITLAVTDTGIGMTAECAAVAAYSHLRACSLTPIAAPPNSGRPRFASKKRRASQRRNPLPRIGQISLWPLMSISAKPMLSGAWNSSAVRASSIRMSACFGRRPPCCHPCHHYPHRFHRRAPSPGIPHASTVPSVLRTQRGRLFQCNEPVQCIRREGLRPARPSLSRPTLLGDHEHPQPRR
jgi:hypothetical protein